MVPKPKALEDRPVFGDKKQIAAMALFREIRNAEVDASYKKNTCQLKFYLGKKFVFEMTVSSKKKAEDLAMKMHYFDDKKWTFDKIARSKTLRGDPVWRRF